MALAEQYIEEEHYTEAEYFGFERTAFGRWGYISSKIRQRSGGTTDYLLPSVNMTLPLRDVYALVKFEAEPT